MLPVPESGGGQKKSLVNLKSLIIQTRKQRPYRRKGPKIRERELG